MVGFFATPKYLNGLSVLKIYSLPYLFTHKKRFENWISFKLVLSLVVSPYFEAKIKPSNESALFQNCSGLAIASLVWVSINDVTLTFYSSQSLEKSPCLFSYTVNVISDHITKVPFMKDN